MDDIRSAIYLVGFLVGALGVTLAAIELRNLLRETDMFGLGKNQMIAIGGGLIIVGAGFAACFSMEPEAMTAFLDFAGSFGWKVIVGATGGSALIKVAAELRG